MSFDDIQYTVCSLTAICQSSETEWSWYLSTTSNMPFKSNIRLTRERVIRYGTSLKNSTDNLHSAMPLNKCQMLSAVCSVEPLHPVCSNGSEEPWETNPEITLCEVPKQRQDKTLADFFMFIRSRNCERL